MEPEADRPYRTDAYDRIGAAWLADEMGRRVLLMQGPMGTALMGQAGAEDIPPAYWNTADPQEVARLHWLYRAAGADLMLTNSFQANELALQRDGVTAGVERINRAAVMCAKKAAAPCVLGSIGPNGVPWLKEGTPEHRRARAAYRRQAYALLSAGASGIMLETFTNLRDLEVALVGTREIADGMPVLVSFAIDESGNLLSDGLNIEAACMRAVELGACSVGVNCCSVPAATAAVPRMVRSVDVPVSVRPNAGAPRRADDGSLTWDEDPQELVAACERWCSAGARIVGACCGTGVLTCSALAGYLDGRLR